jgi:signal transduction histidine kinase
MKRINLITKDPRDFFVKIQAISSIVFVSFHFAAVFFNIWKPPETTFAKLILYFGVPLILLSLYLTAIRKIFSQKLGDIIHSSVLILVISAFAIAYDGRIGGSLVFLFFLLIAVSILFMDDFLPLFIAGVISLIVGFEFFLTTDFSTIVYLTLFKPILQIMSFLVVGWSSSNLVKRTISEQKVSEELRKSGGELRGVYRDIKELSEMKTEFLKIVNHQLRTPVSIIKGMSSMLTEGMITKKKQKEYFKKLYLSSERLHTILDDILAAQDLSGGPAGVDLRPCNIVETVERLISHHKSLAEAKKLKIVFNKPKKSIPLVLLDEEIINRVVFRLIDNAILYTDKGKIEVSLKLTEEKNNKLIQISVKDSGIGLDKKDKKDLFKLFHRGEKATSLHPNGSGLGLFIVKNLIESHRGTVEAKSKGRGKGTTFTIKLPFRVDV